VPEDSQEIVVTEEVEPWELLPLVFEELFERLLHTFQTTTDVGEDLVEPGIAERSVGVPLVMDSCHLLHELGVVLPKPALLICQLLLYIILPDKDRLKVDPLLLHLQK
jgi:hypothetical protein